MRLIEFLDSPLGWKNLKPGMYHFKYNGASFIARFFLKDLAEVMDNDFAMDQGFDPEDVVASFIFGPYNAKEKDLNFKATGKGGSIQIFSTIREIIKDYVSKNRREIGGIFFKADTSEPTRIKLYTRILPLLAKELNATPHDIGSRGRYHEFFLEF